MTPFKGQLRDSLIPDNAVLPLYSQLVVASEQFVVSFESFPSSVTPSTIVLSVPCVRVTAVTRQAAVSPPARVSQLFSDQASR